MSMHAWCNLMTMGDKLEQAHLSESHIDCNNSPLYGIINPGMLLTLLIGSPNSVYELICSQNLGNYIDVSGSATPMNNKHFLTIH